MKAAAAGSSGVADVTPAAMAAAKLGMIDKLLAALDKQPHLTKARDLEGENGEWPTVHRLKAAV